MANFVVSGDWAAYVDLGANVDYATRIDLRVKEAERHDLRPLVTPEFYAELVTVAGSGVDHPDGTLTKAAYDLLLPYIKPFVIYSAYARYITDGSYQETRFGGLIQNTEHSTRPSEAETLRRATEQKSKAADYGADLLDFLKDNASDYPTWRKYGDSGNLKSSLSIFGV